MTDEISDQPAPDPEEPTALEPVEPSEAEPEEGLQFVRTGWVRFRWDGRVLRLRRPFLGELRELRLALEDLSDEIAERSEEIQAEGLRLAAEAEALEERGLAPAEAFEERAKIRTRSKQLARELTGFAEDRRLEWWARAFELLAVNEAEVPADAGELPAYLLDNALPHRVLEHWRAVPLARG